MLRCVKVYSLCSTTDDNSTMDFYAVINTATLRIHWPLGPYFGQISEHGGASGVWPLRIIEQGNLDWGPESRHWPSRTSLADVRIEVGHEFIRSDDAGPSWVYRIVRVEGLDLGGW